jgi:hypothetical protein
MPNYLPKQADPDRCSRCGKSLSYHETCPHCRGPICDRNVREDWDDPLGYELNGIKYHKSCHFQNFRYKYPSDAQVRWLWANLYGVLWGTPEPPLGDLEFHPQFLAELREVRRKITERNLKINKENGNEMAR